MSDTILDKRYAAERGDAATQFELGAMYELGEGVPVASKYGGPHDLILALMGDALVRLDAGHRSLTAPARCTLVWFQSRSTQFVISPTCTKRGVMG